MFLVIFPLTVNGVNLQEMSHLNWQLQKTHTHKTFNNDPIIYLCLLPETQFMFLFGLDFVLCRQTISYEHVIIKAWRQEWESPTNSWFPAEPRPNVIHSTIRLSAVTSLCETLNLENPLRNVFVRIFVTLSWGWSYFNMIEILSPEGFVGICSHAWVLAHNVLLMHIMYGFNELIQSATKHQPFYWNINKPYCSICNDAHTLVLGTLNILLLPTNINGLNHHQMIACTT